MVKLQEIAPAEIETESFRIIEAEFKQQTGREISSYPPGEFKVLQRVIHATGDFSIADIIHFQNDPVDSAIKAIREGGNVITDVNMVASGISSALLSQFGGEVQCGVSDPHTFALAKEKGITRSDAAMQRFKGSNVAIAAIGNAPTALVALIRMIKEGGLRPAVVVGVPVGFVNASESKELLKELDIPAITLTGRRGGSPIAAAITNALIRLAHQAA